MKILRVVDEFEIRCNFEKFARRMRLFAHFHENPINEQSQPCKDIASYTCMSSNVIYAIACSRCEKIYIGETKRRQADRFTEHPLSIKINFPGLPVAAHFN